LHAAARVCARIQVDNRLTRFDYWLASEAK